MMKITVVYVDSERPKFGVQSKASLLALVKRQFPSYQRKRQKERGDDELYFENDCGGFIRADFSPSAKVLVLEK